VFVQHGSTPFDAAGFEARAFLGMAEFEERVASAGLLILHAGAGSVIHAVRAGKVPVVVPRRKESGEHVDDHQLEFARALAETGRVVLAEEVSALPAAVAEALRRQGGGGEPPAPSALVGMVGELLGRVAAAAPGTRGAAGP
jgi:UDP-N-acetylglucosamine transferase subunit ALG13